MPTQSLSFGLPTLLTQNVVYALPARKGTMYCETAAATFEQSATSAFTLATAIAPDANEQIEVAGGFIRSTGGNVNVVIKAA